MGIYKEEEYMIDKKLLIFDIDGTLCDINRPIGAELLATLQALSTHHRIVLASGKPFGYIAGLIRQLGLAECMVIGENGGTLMYSAAFPPKSYYQIDVPEAVQVRFLEIRRSFSAAFGTSIWFQPNDVNLTVFPVDIADIPKIHDFAKQFENGDMNTYYHKDSVDFTPKGFDKGTAVDILLESTGVAKEELYVFGDGSNDLPMLLKTNNAFLVNSSLKGFVPKERFKDYDALNRYLQRTFIEA